MMTRNLKMRFLMSVGFLLITAGLSAIVMLLWNWLMPALFGLIAINFWQALGLLALARILFGSLGHGRRMMHGRMAHGMHGGNPIREKWMKMTAEERKEFIKKRHAHMYGGMPGRCDFFHEHDIDREPEDGSPKNNE